VTTLVVDASAYVFLATTRTKAAAALRDRVAAASCHAPHLLDAEVGNALRRQVGRGALPLPVAEVALDSTAVLVEHRHAHTGALAAGAWRLREHVSFYDALYVALAAALDAQLLTGDGRLARAHGLPCAVEMVTPPPG
jgi:predicted nucleic acid-binding protein